jgi:hypothetical protein
MQKSKKAARAPHEKGEFSYNFFPLDEPLLSPSLVAEGDVLCFCFKSFELHS